MFANCFIVYVIVGLKLFCFRSTTSTLPNCANRTEVQMFLRSPEYRSLYTYNANLTKEASANAANQSVAEIDSDFSLTVNDILPENRSLYLRRRPPKFCNIPANVVFHITLLSLDSINESDMTYMLDLWLTITWIDERLRYPESKRKVCILDPNWIKHLWIPDVIFKNARKVTVHDQIVFNQGLKILHNKVILLLTKLTVSLPCDMTFERYPHDVQVCDMKMESMFYTDSELTFSWDEEIPISLQEIDKALKTPQFKVSDIQTNKCLTQAYASGYFPCIHVVFFLKRSLGYHLIHTYIPSGSVVILSWITFWIKPEAIAARFGLGVTTLLTIATLNTQSQKDLPPESYAKAIDIWMMSCALFVFCSIVEFALVNYLVSRFSVNGENIGKAQDSDKFLHRVRAVFTNERIHIICHNIDRVARAFFPLSFVFLNIWYWNKYLS